MSVNVTFPQLLHLQDFALLGLRLVVAIVFGASGYLHLKDPIGRAKSIELSPALTAGLGAAEALANLALVTGILIQPAALGLILALSTDAGCPLPLCQPHQLENAAVVRGPGAAEKSFPPPLRQRIKPMESADCCADDGGDGVVVAGVVDRADDGLLRVIAMSLQDEEDGRHGLKQERAGVPVIAGVQDGAALPQRLGHLGGDEVRQRRPRACSMRRAGLVARLLPFDGAGDAHEPVQPEARRDRRHDVERVPEQSGIGDATRVRREIIVGHRARQQRVGPLRAGRRTLSVSRFKVGKPRHRHRLTTSGFMARSEAGQRGPDPGTNREKLGDL